MACSFRGFTAYARLSAADLEEEDERVTAELCYRAAMDAARDCGIPVDTVDNAKMELYVYALALHEFDNRGFSVLNQSASAEKYRERKMTQWKVELEMLGWTVPEERHVSGKMEQYLA